jgi:hypothetical protein
MRRSFIFILAALTSVVAAQACVAQPADLSPERAMLAGALAAAQSDYAGIRTQEHDDIGFYTLTPGFLATCSRCGPVLLLGMKDDGRGNYRPNWGFAMHAYAAIPKEGVLRYIQQNVSSVIPNSFVFHGLIPKDDFDDSPDTIVVYEWAAPTGVTLTVVGQERPGRLLRIHISIDSRPKT